MLWNLDAGWLAMAVASVGILAFILAMALHAVMGEDGFGPIGNAVVITLGFFLAILAANGFGYVMTDMTRVLWTGFGGALAGIALLAAAKALLRRL